MKSTVTNQPLNPVHLLFLFLLLAIPAFSGQPGGEPVDSIGILSPQSGQSGQSDDNPFLSSGIIASM